MKYNINDQAIVELTPYGEEILCKYWARVCNISNIPNYNLITKKYKTQLWDIMLIFGNYLYMGNNTPFKDNIIEIENV